MLKATRLVAEPSGAVALAAALFHAQELPECEADGGDRLAAGTWTRICGRSWSRRRGAVHA